MNKTHLTLVGVALLFGLNASTFAGNPAAVSCLMDMAKQQSYTNADIRMACQNARPVFRVLSWTNNGKRVAPKGKITPIAFNNGQINLCGNPCN